MAEPQPNKARLRSGFCWTSEIAKLRLESVQAERGLVTARSQGCSALANRVRLRDTDSGWDTSTAFNTAMRAVNAIPLHETHRERKSAQNSEAVWHDSAA
ncbi:uncharacterized protein UTRI_03375 [Ustilago trichophora]|uniref:Uncharacterized protein n=1 Tax=Ustilago trichophora TaxID=86804 RepID=A0A5C3E3C7_9BASI|nr:uncharacterized protein UTRI_03375 [Ustilago trichophora]